MRNPHNDPCGYLLTCFESFHYKNKLLKEEMVGIFSLKKCYPHENCALLIFWEAYLTKLCYGYLGDKSQVFDWRGVLLIFCN